MQSALYIIIEDGLEQLTLQKLAERSGYSIGAVYRYFASKEVLIAAVQTTVLQQLQTIYTAALTLLQGQVSTLQAPARSLAQILMLGRCFCQFQRRAPARFQLLQSLLSSRAEVLSLAQAQPVLGAVQAQQTLVSALFAQAEATEALSTGDSQQRALIFWAALQGVLSTHKLARFLPGLDVQQLGQQTMQTLLAGWQAPPEALQAAVEILDSLCRSLDFDDLFGIIEELD